MDTQLHSISKIFTERIYRIPDYQRGYAWGDKQLKDFWNDILQLEESKNHYVGVLTLEKTPQKKIHTWDDDRWIIESKHFDPYYIVDGQQRLTTTIILLQSIIDVTKSKKNKILNHTRLEDISRKYICDKSQHGINESFIFGYERDNPSYEYLKRKILNYFSGDGYNEEETIYTSNLLNAKIFFSKRLENNSVEEIEMIFTKLTQRLLFNIYTISTEVDVFVAFETMNNRGKPLSNLELLKNRLIFLSTKLSINDEEKEKLRRLINSCWRSIYHHLGRNKDKPLDDDEFLYNHFVTYFPSRINAKDEDEESFYKAFDYGDYMSFLLEIYFSQKSIYEVSNQFETLKKISNYVESLQTSVELWFDINNPLSCDEFDEKEKIWIEKVLRLDNDHIKVLLLYLCLNKKINHDLVKTLQFVEQIEFWRLLQYGRKAFIPISYEVLIVKSIRNKKGASYVFDEIFKFYTSFEKQPKLIIENIGTRFNSGFYNWSGIKYFLFEYELYLKEKNKAKRNKIFWHEFIKEYDEMSTIEHIFPQNPKENVCWSIITKRFTSDEIKKLRNSLGNLVPISKPRNSALQNRCFKEKIENNKSNLGYRFGSFCENELCRYQEWSAEIIYERGIKLLNFMESRWKVQLGDEKEKAKILGIPFMYGNSIIKKNSR